MLNPTETRIKELYNEIYDHNVADSYLDFLDAVETEFNFTPAAAYVATEFLFRPENMN
jgi:hypothetical protein